MSRFYIGQEVAFIECGKFIHQIMHRPKHNEVCVIIGKAEEQDHWILAGYERSYVSEQDTVCDIIYHEESLRPLISKSESFSETLIKEIETEINEENLILK